MRLKTRLHLIAGQSSHRVIGLTKIVSEFGALSNVVRRINRAYTVQLSLAIGLHFTGALVDVYLFCFHALSLDVPWTTDSIGGVRAINNLWRLSVVSSAAHYSSKQVCISVRVCVCACRCISVLVCSGPD